MDRLPRLRRGPRGPARPPAGLAAAPPAELVRLLRPRARPRPRHRQVVLRGRRHARPRDGTGPALRGADTPGPGPPARAAGLLPRPVPGDPGPGGAQGRRTRDGPG